MNMMNSNAVFGMAYLMAEDTGAPELRNPMNSAMHADRAHRKAIHPLRAIKALVAAMLAM